MQEIDNVTRKAYELAIETSRQINEAKEKLAKEMLERGLNPDLYVIEVVDIGNENTVQYEVRAALKPTEPRMKRGETN